MKHNRKRLPALLLTGAMLTSLAVTASAASFSIPTKPLSTDDNVIKTTAARAGQIAPLILGCDLVGSSNLGASSEDHNQVNSILGVFGSDINESPDPYLYNYSYNLYAADKGLPLVENAAVATDQAEGTPSDTENALRTLTHRPDLMLTQAPGTGSTAAHQTYIPLIPTLPENQDADPSNDFDPSYYTCSISTLVYQCDNLVNLSQVVNDVCDKKDLTTRYGDPYVIATNYDKFVWGHYFYVQKQLAEGKLEKKTTAVISKTEDNGANWTLPAIGTAVDQKKPNRLVEYVRDNTDTLNTTSETVAPLADILARDVVIANGNGAVLRSAAAAAGCKEADLPLIIETLPTCLYGMIMQTHENALGIPYLQSIIYGDELGLNPVYAAAYYYEHFFHITHQAALQETVTTLLGSATLPDGVTTSLNQYDPKAVEAVMTEGIRYAVANGLKRHDDPKPWQPDLSVGVGKGTLPFTDLTQDWYQDAVKYVYENHLFGGTSYTTFAPETTMTRAMAVTVLYRLAGEPAVTTESSFTDLTQDWYKAPVAWAAANGITNGTSGNNTFTPDGQVTLEEFITFLGRYAEKLQAVELPEGRTDAYAGGVTAVWAAPAMTWAVNSHMLDGIQGTAHTLPLPSAPVARAQIALTLLNASK